MLLVVDWVLCAPTDDDLPAPMLPGPDGVRAASLKVPTEGGTDSGRPRLTGIAFAAVACTSREAHAPVASSPVAEDAGPLGGPACTGGGIGTDPASVNLSEDSETVDAPT